MADRIAIKITSENLAVKDNKLLIMFSCPKCKRKKTVEEFGLRNMGDGTIRRQSQCTQCRSTK